MADWTRLLRGQYGTSSIKRKDVFGFENFAFRKSGIFGARLTDNYPTVLAAWGLEINRSTHVSAL